MEKLLIKQNFSALSQKLTVNRNLGVTDHTFESQLCMAGTAQDDRVTDANVRSAIHLFVGSH